MTITYYGHACFGLTAGDSTIIIDPYDSSVPGFSKLNLTADAVYTSHDHEDHCYTEAVSLSGKSSAFTVEEFASFHDNERGHLRGTNTVRIFSAEGVRVLHAGDLGHTFSEKELAAMGKVDVLLLPVGGVYSLNADLATRLALQFNAKLVIPMHYRDGHRGYKELDTTAAFEKKIAPYYSVNVQNTNSVDYNTIEKKQVCILKYLGGTNHEQE